MANDAGANSAAAGFAAAYTDGYYRHDLVVESNPPVVIYLGEGTLPAGLSMVNGKIQGPFQTHSQCEAPTIV